MKVYGIISFLVMFLCGVGMCGQAERERMPQVEELKQEAQVRRMERQMQAEETEFAFDQEMRRLELEKKRIEVEKMRQGARHHDDGGKVVFVLGVLTVHILLAVWVYRDIKERGKGSGIWVAVVLLAGILGVIPYAIVRLGDMR